MSVEGEAILEPAFHRSQSMILDVLFFRGFCVCGYMHRDQKSIWGELCGSHVVGVWKLCVMWKKEFAIQKIDIKGEEMTDSLSLTLCISLCT